MSCREIIPFDVQLFLYLTQGQPPEVAVRFVHMWINYARANGPISAADFLQLLSVPSMDPNGIDTRGHLIRIPFLDRWRAKQRKFIEKQRHASRARWEKRVPSVSSI